MKVPAAIQPLVNTALSHWERGEPGRETPVELLYLLYGGWVTAFFLKVLGSSWDVSWHFKWLRDDLAPPHLINSVGTGIVVTLVIVHTYTGLGVDRLALRLMQWGTGTFLVAVPLDLINHRVNGLDITSWSPSHMLLYIGTAFMIAGVIRGWYVCAAPGRIRDLGLLALFVYCMENTLFPAQHQEYGVFGIMAWDRGEPYAEPILLQFAADQMERPVDREMVVNFSLPAADWVYPVYMVAAVMFALVVARMLVGFRFTATVVAAVYVAYRCVIWPLLFVADFPPSAIPFFLVATALVVDLVFMIPMEARIRAVAGALLITAGGYGALAAQSSLYYAPPLVPASAPVAAGVLVVAWFVTLYGPGLVSRLRTRESAPPLPRTPRPSP
ncbi:hypothetical protein [Rhizohabitans arisaemae]|uniref:hypothetical protein n=1 Tax=Rhizohabitans arisaemae TaxID=2720610 RepID=UPI0024B06712|nr:hypothetical protein [Rhizohabitans arisaemae]